MALGKKQMDQLICFIPTFVAYGMTGAIGTIYVTDWKVVVKYIPFYNGQFAEEKKK